MIALLADLLVSLWPWNKRNVDLWTRFCPSVIIDRVHTNRVHKETTGEWSGWKNVPGDKMVNKEAVLWSFNTDGSHDTENRQKGEI